MLTILSASEVQITADRFTADEAKGVSVFMGNVHVIKGEDDLKADKIIVNFDKNKQPTLYTAIGHAKAKLIIKNKNATVGLQIL